MTMMELLTIPGMNGSEKIMKMYHRSQKDMQMSMRAQRMAAAMMSSRTLKKKQLEKR